MKAYHNTREELYRWPYGALPAGEGVMLRLWTDENCRVTLRAWTGEEKLYPMEDTRGFAGGYLHELQLNMPETTGWFWYEFRIAAPEGNYVYAAREDQSGGEGRLYAGSGPSFQISIYDPDYTTPAWMKRGVMYQIFVDRFRMKDDLRGRRTDIVRHERWNEPPCFIPLEENPRGNQSIDFFGGNLRGIVEKLDYLRDLGVTVLYLNPVFQAYSNHKYDTGDYHHIDPTFGDDADFTALCDAARAKGMRVVLDGVFSHTGADSVYFDKFGHYGGKGAYSDPTSPYRNWYTFTEYPDEYECWWGVTSLPNVREEEPSYVDFIMDGENAVATHWLDRGASGWRLDVADELPMDFLRRLRKRVKARDPEAVLIGEVWEDASNKVSYGEMRNYCAGDSLDSVMNYPLREALMLYLKGEISAEEAASRLSALYENYPKPFAEALMNLIGSHDRSRVINALVGVEGEGVPPWEWGDIILTDEQRKTGRARMLRMLIFSICMPGIPCVYYGDEVGMEGLRDPYNRCPYPWGEEDQEAFSAYSSILRLRRDYLDMPGADTRIESAGDVLILRRMLEEERLICAIAPGARNFSLCAENADEFYDLESAAIRPQQGLLHFHIPECGYAVFRNG